MPSERNQRTIDQPAAATVLPTPRDPPRTPETLIFLHIPKTGGTTVTSALRRAFPPAAVAAFDGTCQAESLQRFRRLPEAEKEGVRLLTGHVGFGIHRFLSQPATYATVLRHPVDRIMSAYFYVLRSPDHYLHRPVTENKLDLVDFALSDLSAELDNLQVRTLSATDGVVHAGPLTAEHLQTARSNLGRSFAAVGVLEHLPAFLFFLQRRFRDLKMVHAPALNVTPGRPALATLSASAYSRILSRNRLDFELYVFAREMLEARIDSLAPGRKAMLLFFRTCHQWWQFSAHARAAGGRAWRRLAQR